MKKLFQYFRENIFFLLTIFLLVFIPLYPKLPLLDIKNTWVYVRVEDFVVLFALFVWAILLTRKKTTLVTPISIPILVFWFIGLLSTVHGMFLIFPHLSDAYANVAFLSFLRRIEYISLFFIGYEAMKNKRLITIVMGALTLTILGVVLYGIGQKYLGFPAYLTMNEEFAKGTPIRLSALSRISSTFSGHYDLAAFLAFVLPIIASMFFAFRQWFLRAILFITVILGLIVMIMTVSRISLFALLIALGIVVFFQKKRLIVISVPFIVIAAIILIRFSPSIIDRFKSTVREVEILIDAKTGDPVGHIKVVPKDHFKDKVIKQQFARSIKNLYEFADSSTTLIWQYDKLEEEMVLFLEPNAPTGENLPQGTGYINLTLAPVRRRLGYFYYEPAQKIATTSAEVFIINGDFLLKNVLAYDLSFTTRFQGEWPRAIDAFRRNILFGSGYGSVGLAVDNSYLRMLAEVGLLGFGAFMAIFIVTAIYIRKILPEIDNLETRSFILGFTAGVAGLLVNALFIDVFEASKLAFILWLMFGIVLGILQLYKKKPFNLYKPIQSVVTSPFTIAFSLFILTVVLYSPMLRNNFVGDDFTWFRWVSDCGKSAAKIEGCKIDAATIVSYFTETKGFFYRPGTKLYFLVMYSIFWLNQSVYHAVSLTLHAGVTILVFLLARKIIRSLLLCVAAAVIFLLISGNAESIYWVSTTGHLFTAFFSLLSLYNFISWRERNKILNFILTLLFFIFALLFHEMGIVTPFFYLLYMFAAGGIGAPRQRLVSTRYALLFAPLPVYLLMRYQAGSHWLSGDYNYNLLKLPFNIVGNMLGYLLLSLAGPFSLPMVQIARNAGRNNIILAAGAISVICIFAIRMWRRQRMSIGEEDRKILIFGIGIFIISLLPFIGLGNITSRYSYLASVGLVFVIVIVFKKLYFFLLGSGRMIALLTTLVIAGTLGMFQLVQHLKVQSDWYEAGEKSKRFVVAMEDAYQDYWSKEPMEFHFVNVPIRYGEAWLFPVGISDALWFIFRNPQHRVFTWPTISQAMEAVNYNDKNQKVFEFISGDMIVERRKTLDVQ